MFGGMLCGYLLRRRAGLLGLLSRLVMPAVWLLLFLMGVTVGANDAVMENLPTLGLEALLLTLGALGGSIVLARWVWLRFFKPHADEK